MKSISRGIRDLEFWSLTNYNLYTQFCKNICKTYLYIKKYANSVYKMV